MLPNEPRRPKHAMPLARLVLPVYPPKISLGTDHQDETGLADLRLAPGGPALRRKLLILIDQRVDPLGSQPVRQAERAILMGPGYRGYS